MCAHDEIFISLQRYCFQWNFIIFVKEILPMDITGENYHADTTHFSKSALDKIAKSPRHYWARYLAPPEKRVRDRSKELEVGTALHILVLEQDSFQDRVAIAPDLDMRYKDSREKMMRFQDEHGHKTIIDRSDYDALQYMRDSIMDHPYARAALTGEMLIEQTYTWTDPDTLAPCKCRYDTINTSLGISVDLKSTKDASPSGFAASVARYRYHVQEAFYGDGYASSEGSAALPWFFVAVEKEPPYITAVYQLDDEAVRIGRALYKRDLATAMRCRQQNRWPGYDNDEFATLTLPKWATFI
jgi:exodeoxyribonuclease VIII